MLSHKLSIVAILLTSVIASNGQDKNGLKDLFQVKSIVPLSTIDNEGWDIPQSYVETEMRKAIDAARNGQYRESITLLRYLKSNVSDPYFIEFHIGLIFFENEQFPLAIKHFQNAINLKPTFIVSRFYLGLAHLNMGQKEESREHFNSFRNIEAFEHMEVYGKGMIALKERKELDAMKLFKQSFKIDPTFLPAIEELIRFYLADGKQEKALKWIGLGIEKNPDWIVGHLYSIATDIQNNSTSIRNLNTLNKFLQKDPGNSNYLYLRGFHYLLNNDHRNAVESFEKSFYSMSANNKNGINAEELDLVENTKLALMYYREHSPVDTKTMELMDQAICSFITGREQTIAQLQILERLKTGYGSMIKMMYGLIYMTLGEDAEAIDVLGESILLDSSNWAAHLIRGKLFYEYTYPDYAAQDFSQARFLQPELEEVYHVAGRIYSDNLEHERAYNSLTKSIEIDGQDNSILYLTATTAMKLEKYKEAISDFKRVTNQDPFNSPAYKNIYKGYINIGDTTLAMLYLDSASQYSKSDHYPHQELIRMGKILNLPKYMEMGYSRLVNYHPLNVENILNRGKYYYDNKMYQNALGDFERGIHLLKSRGYSKYLEEFSNWRARSLKEIKKAEDSE